MFYLRSALADQRHDRDPSVSADHWAVHFGRVDSVGLSNEGVGPDNVQCGDAEDSGGVVFAGFLEHLGGDGNGRVHGVGNNGEHGFGADLY